MPEEALTMPEIMDILRPMADRSGPPEAQIAYATLLYTIVDTAFAARPVEALAAA